MTLVLLFLQWINLKLWLLSEKRTADIDTGHICNHCNNMRHEIHSSSKIEWVLNQGRGRGREGGSHIKKTRESRRKCFKRRFFHSCIKLQLIVEFVRTSLLERHDRIWSRPRRTYRSEAFEAWLCVSRNNNFVRRNSESSMWQREGRSRNICFCFQVQSRNEF